jgi:hypothetical protein
MHKFTGVLLSILFGCASFTSIALTQALHPVSGQTSFAFGNAAIALADPDRDNEDPRGDDNQRGNPHGCVNPAGHVRGWCKHGNQNARYGNYRGNYSTISGTVIALNGDLVQFRRDNGATITLNQASLLSSGTGLRVGGHYALRGYWSNNMFIAQAPGGTYGTTYPNGGNGYPYGGNASVQGVITSISGDRVTIMQGLFSTVTINDQQALNNGAAQNLYVGRNVTAYGFWSGSVFYATTIS